MTAIDNLFAAGARMVSEEAIELTLQSLRAYWDRHEHVAIAWSGGKDSTATLTLMVHLIEAGELPRPARLFVFYADTRQELPPIQIAAEQVMALLRLRHWIEVVVVRAPLDKRFMVYILGRGVPPPNNNTLRWCTRQIKVEPMAEALAAAIAGLPGAANVPGVCHDVKYLLARQTQLFDRMLVHPGVGFIVAGLLSGDGLVHGDTQSGHGTVQRCQVSVGQNRHPEFTEAL